MTEPGGSAPSASTPEVPSFDLAASAGRIGGYAWLAARLYEVTGDWVPSTDEPWVKARLAEISARFAWQAAEWVERLPHLREAPRDTFLVAPGPSVAALFDEMADITATEARVSSLLVVTEQLGALLALHEHGLDVLRDRSVGHTLRMIRRDLEELDAALVSIGGRLVTSGTPKQALDEAFRRWRGRLAAPDLLLA